MLKLFLAISLFSSLSANYTQDLIQAITTDDEYSAKIAIFAGAKLNYRIGVRRDSLLHHAADLISYKVGRLLIALNANVNAENKNRFTPLMVSANHDDDEFMTLLIDNHANIDAINKFHESALIIAMNAGAFRAAKLLLKHGAVLNLQLICAFPEFKKDNLSKLINEVILEEQAQQILIENTLDAFPKELLKIIKLYTMVNKEITDSYLDALNFLKTTEIRRKNKKVKLS